MNQRKTFWAIWVVLVVAIVTLGIDPQIFLRSTETVTAIALPIPQNVLMIVADDMGVDMFPSLYGGLGTNPPSTPNINALAQQGVVFEKFYTNPVCCPTRTTLLTGVYSNDTGIGEVIFSNSPPGTHHLLASQITIPEMLDAGTNGLYRHAAIGKWHLGFEHTHPNVEGGFQDYAGGMWNFSDSGEAYDNFQKVTNGQVSQSTTYATTDEVNDAINRIQSWNQTSPDPWFLYLAFHAPHYPWHIPPSNLHSQGSIPNCNGVINRQKCYRAAAEAMDTEIGRLIANISPKVLRRTTIIFLADNGSPPPQTLPPFNPDHAKGRLYEEGVHVPLIVKSPLSRSPGVSSALVNSTDLFATVAELARVNLNTVIPPSAKLNSVSIVPYLKNPSLPSIRQFVFTEHFRPNNPLGGDYIPAASIPHCQPDQGYPPYPSANGPQLTICGDVLNFKNKAELLLTNIPPNADVDIYSADYVNPTSFGDGTAYPYPPREVSSYTADANGELRVPDFINLDDLDDLDHANVDNVYQAIITDPTQPGGYQLSNVIAVNITPLNQKAVRNATHKLIESGNGNPPYRELFNLLVDPFEQNNLYPPAPSSQDEVQYNILKAQLDALIQ